MRASYTIYGLFALLVASSCVALPRSCGTMNPTAAPTLQTTSLDLVQVNAVFRHGDRTNYQDLPCWPGDTAIYECGLAQVSSVSPTREQPSIRSGRLLRLNYMQGRNFFAGNCATGQLTDRGWMQLRNLGKLYREVYVDQYHLLTEEFSENIMYLRTDSDDRNVESMDGLLAGLYPVVNNTSAAWPAWNVDTMDSVYDDISPNPRLCPIFKTYTQNFTQTSKYQQHVVEYSNRLYSQLSEALGIPVDGFAALDQSHDCLIVHACHDQPMPEGVTRQLFDAVMAEYSYVAWSMYNYPSMEENTRAGIGFLLQEIVGYMDNRVAGNSSFSATFWSGHDTTIAPLLNALGMWDGAWIPYASHVELELWVDNDSEEFFLRVLYNGHVVSDQCGSDGLCPYDTFRTYVENLFPIVSECSVE